VISNKSLNQVEDQTNLMAISDNNLTSILDEELNLIKADYSSANLSTLQAITTIVSNYEISEYSFKGSNNKIITDKSLLFPTRNVVLK
jgi:acetolactate synthase small subunit